MKQIIFTKRQRQNKLVYEVVYWAIVAVGNKVMYADPGFVSAYKDVSPQELADLRDGTVAEQVDHYEVNPSDTLAQTGNKLIARWNAWNDHVSTASPTIRAGTYYDGTKWVKGT